MPALRGFSKVTGNRGQTGIDYLEMNARKKGGRRMKKITVLLLTGVMLVVFAVSAWGLNTPAVSRSHGVITGRFVSDHGLFIGGEYGITQDMAVHVELAPSNLTKVGLKYQTSPNLAVTGGIIGSSVFFGINGSTALTRELTGIAELDVTMADNRVNLLYELGARFNIDQRLDIRGGLMGFVSESAGTPLFQLGVGYKF